MIDPPQACLLSSQRATKNGNSEKKLSNRRKFSKITFYVCNSATNNPTIKGRVIWICWMVFTPFASTVWGLCCLSFVVVNNLLLIKLWVDYVGNIIRISARDRLTHLCIVVRVEERGIGNTSLQETEYNTRILKKSKYFQSRLSVLNSRCSQTAFRNHETAHSYNSTNNAQHYR